jgi:hypothetical protein
MRRSRVSLSRKEKVINKETQDQIAAVMLQHGTPEQQKEALLHCTSNITAARVENLTPSAYRLKRSLTSGELVLQGCFTWQQGWSESGFDWRDIPTVEE